MNDDRPVGPTVEVEVRFVHVHSSLSFYHITSNVSVSAQQSAVEFEGEFEQSI